MAFSRVRAGRSQYIINRYEADARSPSACGGSGTVVLARRFLDSSAGCRGAARAARAGRIAPPQRQPQGGSNFQPTPEQQKRRQFTIAGEDHTPIKARVLLMVALTKTQDRNELQRIFSEY